MLQARTLPPLPFENSASPDDLQRVRDAPNDYSQSIAASSRQLHRQDSRSIGIQKLLNPVGCEGRSNACSGLDLPLPSTVNTGLLVSSRSDAHSLSLARPSPYRPVSQDTPYSLAQNCEGTRGIDPEAPQPASQGNSPCTQYSSYSRISQTESVLAPLVVSTGQPQYYSSNPSSGPTSTMPRMPLGTKAFEMPTSSAAAQRQYRMMVLETAQGPIQVPVDVQAASKVQNEKRKRNATASHNFRQRRKKKERETSEKIATFEARLRDAVEEKNHYLQERNYFQDVVLRHRLPMASRPPSPWRKWDATTWRAPFVRYQEAGGSGRTSGL